MSTDKIIKILNEIRESYELDFAECEYARDCEKCKECYAYEAAQALGYAINAVKFKEKYGERKNDVPANIIESLNEGINTVNRLNDRIKNRGGNNG